MDGPCFTVQVIAGSVSGVIAAAIIVVMVIMIVCVQYLKFKKKACQQHEELALKNKVEDNVDADRRECRERDRVKEQRRALDHQWSREQAKQLLEDIREMRECAKTNVEMYRVYMDVAKEVSDKLISSLATDSGDVVTDSEEERNKEMEREQKEQLLNLLRNILRGGRRNKSLKAEMLVAITEEVGSDVNDFVDQKCQCTCL